MDERFDVVIIGGGIAGISLAARLATHLKIAVLEAEEHPGQHATGRSAALLVEAYGPPEIRRLTGMSRAFFEAPPAGFCETALTRRRGGLIYGAERDLPRLREEYELARETTDVLWLDKDAVLACCPILEPGGVAAGFLEPSVLDLDATALLQGFLRSTRRAGGAVRTTSRPERTELAGGEWLVTHDRGRIACSVLVNAAGAWADSVARAAGVPPLGLQPMRRSAASLPMPPNMEAQLTGLPFVAPVDESFYFKPEARGMMVSLADETPSDPCDAFADDLDIAIAWSGFTRQPASRARDRLRLGRD
jgi:D-arginine dehydrogenase